MKKYALYILILIALVGLFGPVLYLNAQAKTPGCYTGTARGDRLTNITTEANCAREYGNGYYWLETNGNITDASGTRTPTGGTLAVPTNPAYADCVRGIPGVTNPGTPAGCALQFPDTAAYTACVTGGNTPQNCQATANAAATASTTTYESSFEAEIAESGCTSLWSGSVPGCLIQIFNFIFHVIPSFLLGLVAYVFNLLIHITLYSTLFTSSAFIPEAWAIVRDLSNIFFILILLYIAIKLILGLSGHDVKSMIVRVIIMAMLINFSMFFTKVVIDTSNILALIFYNKISVQTSSNGQVRPYASVSGEKDVAGGLVSAFDPTKTISAETFAKSKEVWYNGRLVRTESRVPAGTMMALILISGLVAFFAIYALFISGISFIGRLIELWILIIFSPFAMMSSSVPFLSNIEYLGWEDWLKRLLKMSFMAPIFMFFLYLIFKLVHAKIFNSILQPNNGESGLVTTLLLVLIPAMIILAMLLKAADFAKKGGGQFGEMAIGAGKMVAGLAVGGAAGLALGAAAGAARATVGGGGGYVANKAASKANQFAAWSEKKFGTSLGANKLASGFTGVGAMAQKSSFDIRGVKIGGKTLASATGLNLGEAQKGGIEQARKEKIEKRKKRANMLNVRQDEGLMKAANQAEEDLQLLLNQAQTDLEKIDADLVSARQKKNDARSGSTEEATHIAEIARLRAHKNAIKDGSMGPTVTRNGRVLSIEDLEDNVIPDAKNAIIKENRRRKVAFANRKGNWGMLSSTANRQARHEIIMESKIKSSDDS